MFSAAFANPLGPQTKCFLHTMAPGAVIEIANDVGISSTTLVAREKIQIGERTIIGADCLIVDTDFHSLNAAVRQRAATDHPKAKAVQIGNSVFVGARCILLKGVVINEASVLGAGSVLSRAVPQKTLFAGNPASFIKTL